MEQSDFENGPDTEGAGSGADLPGSPSTSAAGTEAGDGSIGTEEAGAGQAVGGDAYEGETGTETGEPDRGFARGEGGLGGGASDPDPVDDANPDTNGVG
jgi:hypothetical protein